jgi:hypothetical protein
MASSSVNGNMVPFQVKQDLAVVYRNNAVREVTSLIKGYLPRENVAMTTQELFHELFHAFGYIYDQNSVRFSSLPLECVGHAFSFLCSGSVRIAQKAADCARISLVSKMFCKEASIFDMVGMKKVLWDALTQKYTRYNQEYRESIACPPERRPQLGMADPFPPQLLDAVSTGSGKLLSLCTFNEYSSEIERDIFQIVRLMPQSLFCAFGQMRCRLKVTPLAMACVNNNIPLSIIEFFFQQGADANATLIWSISPIKILHDLKRNMSLARGRMEAIEKLFYQYGFVDEEPPSP